ncbi:MAG: efflux RND transporter periplasmic adaptor subunit [Fibrobacter sp.]|nr:efflux RND transporter periplasmic adaptor subunit [Fibrobacter sp.]MDY6369509.1 efflux RND transporter periplasmic adaptor subunit [Fibrobacter sp.]MDY6390765.1 efflux RND transporter periplasmic adaptor subunit [Fibrobacter sp.]
MKKIIRILMVLAVLFAIVFAVHKFFFATKTENVGVMVSEKVKRVTIQTTISSTGTISPMDTVSVGTQVSGDISKIYVDFNSKVKKGQVIAELDRSKLQATLYQAQIAESSAKNDYEHKLAVYNRIKKLAESNSASAVDLETAEYEMNSAKFSWESRKSEVQQAKLNLSYCIIKSPIDGVVLERSVDVGQTVAASMSAPTLFVLAKDLSKMRVMADVDEADIGQVKAGQKVTFTVDAFQDDMFKGTVESVRLNPTVTSNVVTYTVVITAENSDLKLLPGMTATCTIVTEEVENALSVPVTAIKFTPAAGTPMMDPREMPRPEKSEKKSSDSDDDFGPPPGMMGGPMGGGSAKKSSSSTPKLVGKGVWIDVNGKAAFRPVKTGINDGVNVQITAGLAEGDSVVVRQEAATVASQSAGEAVSPFMPGPRKKKK